MTEQHDKQEPSLPAMGGDIRDNTAPVGVGSHIAQASGDGAHASVTHTEHHHYADDQYDVRGLANPYLGLAAFTYDDRERYAGRERVVQQAVDVLTAPGEQRTLLFITGASGSGKSSFAQAGLIPALEQYYGRGVVQWAVFRPSRYPIDSLLDALQRRVNLPVHTLDRDKLLQSLYPFLSQYTSPPYVLTLVIDQFEELFSQSDHTQRDQLFATLTNLPPFAELRTHLIATVRADYLPELFAHQVLYDQAKRGIDLRVMHENELKQAIQRPIQQTYPNEGKYFEDALLDKLAQDAAGDAAYLPLLQATLSRLWNGGILKLGAYTSLADAIQQQAEDVYVNNPDGTPRPTAGQQAILALLLELVDVSLQDDDRGDVRRRRPHTELLHTVPERRSLVKELADARLLSTGRETRADKEVEVVDIIHESLLNNWTRLRDAINSNRETLQQRVRFELVLQAWQENACADAYLLEGHWLVAAEELAKQGDVALRNSTAKEFLKLSVTKRETKRKRQLRRLRMTTVVLAVLLVLAVGASWFAFDRQQAAKQQTDQARSQLLVSDAQAALLRQDPDQALTLSLAAVQDDRENERELVTLSQAAYAPGTLLRFIGHTSGVNTVTVSPDGHSVLSGSWDHTIRLWNAKNGEEIRRFTDQDNSILSAAISRDGRTVLFGTTDGAVVLWDSISGEEVTRFTGHTDWVLSVVFSSDGRTALSGSADDILYLWDIASGRQLQRFAGHTDDVRSVAFHPHRQTVLSGSGDGTVRLWDIASGTEVHRIQAHSSAVSSVAFSPDGERILSGSWDTTMTLWDVISQEQVETFVGHTAAVTSVAFSPDGQFILSSSRDNTLRLWQITPATELYRFHGHRGAIEQIAFHPNGHTAFSASADGTLRQWSLSHGAEVFPHGLYTGWVESVAFSPHQNMALVGGYDSYLKLIDVESWEEVRNFDGHTAGVLSVAFSPDGTQALSGSWDWTMRLWDVATGENKRVFHSDSGAVKSVAFSPDGYTVLCGTEAGLVRLWNPESGEVVRDFSGHDRAIQSVAFSPDATMVLTASEDRTIRLWDVRSGKELRRFEGHGASIESVAFSPDGHFILSGSFDNTVRLWNIDNGQEQRRFVGHTATVESVAFSPHGEVIVSGSEDTTIRLWNIDNGQEVGRLQGGFRSAVKSLAVNPDGSALLSGSADGTVRFLRLDTPDALIAWTCKQRYVPALITAQQARYGLSDDLLLCPEE